MASEQPQINVYTNEKEDNKSSLKIVISIIKQKIHRYVILQYVFVNKL